MGAWHYLREYFDEVLEDMGRGSDRIAYAGRGHAIIDLPRVSVEARADFMLRALGLESQNPYAEVA